MNPLHIVLRLQMAFASRCRNVWFRGLGVRLTGYVWMRKISIPRQWSDITIEKGVSLDDGVVLLSSGNPKPDRLIIRSGTYINRYTMLDASDRLEIGANCMIGPYCYLTDHDHGQSAGELLSSQPLVGKAVRIGNNVWLGAGVIVLKGVTIGDHAVVGAGAVVTKDVRGGDVVAGVPARSLEK